MSDGIRNTTRVLRRVEPLISVNQLKKQYLHGLETRDNEGREIDDTTFQQYIDVAIDLMETYLDINIVERTEVEEKDHNGNEYLEWGYFQLNNIPVRKVEEIKVVYLRDAAGIPQNVLTIPESWIRLKEHSGIVRLVPNNAFPANLQISAGGSFFPELFQRYSNIPQLWSITYKAGFEDGKVPVLINAAIGLLAAIFALNNSADLILGAGIASQSISIDGLSQSINSTSSAENHNNSAKVKEYYTLLYGDSINSPNRGILRTLHDFWQAQSIQII